jgi:hypothetical protein
VDRLGRRKALHGRPHLESLDGRVVLSMVDLTTAGAAGTITTNGIMAVHQQGPAQRAWSGIRRRPGV